MKKLTSILLMLTVSSNTVLAQNNSVQNVDDDIAKAECSGAFEHDQYNKNFKPIVDKIHSTPSGSYQGIKSNMTDNIVSYLINEGITNASMKAAGNPGNIVAKTITDYMNSISENEDSKDNLESFFKADENLENASKSEYKDPTKALSSYQAKQHIAEFMSERKNRLDAFMRLQDNPTPENLEDIKNIKKNFVDECSEIVAARSRTTANITKVENNNILAIAKEYQKELEKDEKARNKLVIVPPIKQGEAYCKYKNLVGADGKEAKCDSIGTAVEQDDWKDFINLFGATGKEDGHNGYFSKSFAGKSYCKDCLSKNFGIAASALPKRFKPKSDLAKELLDEIDDTRNIFMQGITSKNKAPSKTRANKAWDGIRDRFKEKLTKNLIKKKVSVELAKTTGLLQQLYHFKAQVNSDDHEDFDNAFSCYDKKEIESRMEEYCDEDNLKDAKDTLAEGFEDYTMKDTGNALVDRFEDAFDDLHKMTDSPQEMIGSSICRDMKREDYAKAQNFRLEQNGTKGITDYFLKISMTDTENLNLNPDNSQDSLVLHRINKMKKDVKEGNLSPVRYLSEMFAINIWFSKSRPIADFLIRGDKALVTEGSLPLNNIKETILKPLLENKVVPLEDNLNDANGIQFADATNALTSLMMDHLHKMGSVDPNYNALMQNKDMLSSFENNFKSKGDSLGVSQLLKAGIDGKSPTENMLAKFKQLQEKPCEEFIENIAKFSCTPLGDLENFSRDDINNEIKKIAKENEKSLNLHDKEHLDNQEKLIVDIALGSLHCEYNSTIDIDTPNYKTKPQIEEITDAIDPLLQSDHTSRMNMINGKDDGKGITADYHGNFASQEYNCAQKDLVTDLYDCKNKVNLESCGDTRKNAKKINKKVDDMEKLAKMEILNVQTPHNLNKEVLTRENVIGKISNYSGTASSVITGTNNGQVNGNIIKDPQVLNGEKLVDLTGVVGGYPATWEVTDLTGENKAEYPGDRPFQVKIDESKNTPTNQTWNDVVVTENAADVSSANKDRGNLTPIRGITSGVQIFGDADKHKQEKLLQLPTRKMGLIGTNYELDDELAELDLKESNFDEGAFMKKLTAEVEPEEILNIDDIEEVYEPEEIIEDVEVISDEDLKKHKEKLAKTTDGNTDEVLEEVTLKEVGVKGKDKNAPVKLAKKEIKANINPDGTTENITPIFSNPTKYVGTNKTDYYTKEYETYTDSEGKEHIIPTPESNILSSRSNKKGNKYTSYKDELDSYKGRLAEEYLKNEKNKTKIANLEAEAKITKLENKLKQYENENKEIAALQRQLREKDKLKEDDKTVVHKELDNSNLTGNTGLNKNTFSPGTNTYSFASNTNPSGLSDFSNAKQARNKRREERKNKRLAKKALKKGSKNNLSRSIASTGSYGSMSLPVISQNLNTASGNLEISLEKIKQNAIKEGYDLNGDDVKFLGIEYKGLVPHAVYIDGTAEVTIPIPKDDPKYEEIMKNHKALVEAEKDELIYTIEEKRTTLDGLLTTWRESLEKEEKDNLTKNSETKQ